MKKTSLKLRLILLSSGLHDLIRTGDLSLRRRVLYPAELRRQVGFAGFLCLPTICLFFSGGCSNVTLGGGRSILLSYADKLSAH